MNTQAVQKEVSREKSLVVSPEFKQYALTQAEQDVFAVLYYAKHAMNAFEVYRRVAYGSILREINLRRKSEGKPPASKSASYFNVEKAIIYEDGKPVGEISQNKKEFMEFVAINQKKRGIVVPTYSLFVRILSEFSQPPFNWIKVRDDATGKAKALYFLDDEMRTKVKTELASALLIS